MKCFKKMQIIFIRIILIVTTMMLGTTSILYAAGEITTFSPGQTISSAQVNANFQAHSAQIAALQTQLAALSPVSIAPVSIVGIYDILLLGQKVGPLRVPQVLPSTSLSTAVPLAPLNLLPMAP